MPHLSDHCHLSFALKANLFSSNPPGGFILIEHKRLFQDIFKSKDRLKDCLESQSPQTVQSSLEAATNHDNIDTAFELLKVKLW